MRTETFESATQRQSRERRPRACSFAALSASSRRRRRGLVTCLMMAGLSAGSATAQGPLALPGNASETPLADASPTSRPEIIERLAEVVGELEKFEAEREWASAADARQLDEQIVRLRQIETLLEKQKVAVTAVDAVRPTSTEVGPTTEPSIFALDALYEKRFTRLQRADDAEIALAASLDALASARKEFDAAEGRRREARRDSEQKQGGERASALRALRLRQLESRRALEEINLRTLEMAAARRTRVGDRFAEEFETSIESMRASLQRGEGDSETGFAALTQREGDLQRTRETTERRLAIADLRLDSVQKHYAEQTQPPTGSLGEIEALTSTRDAIRQELSLVDEQLEQLAGRRLTWENWESLIRNDAEAGKLGRWTSTAKERAEGLKQSELRRQGRISEVQRRFEGLERELARLEPTSSLRTVLQEEREVLSRLQPAQFAHLSSIAFDLRLTRRFLDDAIALAGHFDALAYATGTAQGARDFWNYEITTVDDQPISVGSLVIALFLSGIGLWAARRGSALVRRIAMERISLDAGGAQALQTLSFYALLIGFSLLALRAVHFPLTAFTVLGGAMAIGVGFGSQNVMNNFISGLILMLERPVRALDVIEVDGNHGAIERIGARSTQIRSTDGRHIIVPNSFFLESNVVNWTLSDDLIRAKVSVGVVYGSPTRLVESLIQRVVSEDEMVLASPEPIIIFEEFGDNALVFDVYFWVRARSPMSVRVIQSRVRFGIDDLFREHDLVIAFPQRDVHLDTPKPLEVRVLRETDTSSVRPDPAESKRRVD